MTKGLPLNRHWIFVLKNGIPVYDWGNGLAQDLMSGEFLQIDESDVSYPIGDDELEVLSRAGRVVSYDEHQVYIHYLPPPPRQVLE